MKYYTIAQKQLSDGSFSFEIHASHWLRGKVLVGERESLEKAIQLIPSGGLYSIYKAPNVQKI